MGVFLGFDTSNYFTSTALYDSESGQALQSKKLLPVAEGTLGLRQSDAVFAHVSQLGGLVEALMKEAGGQKLSGVGVSVRPRDVQGSYMPCFLVGSTVARSAAAVLGVPLTEVSHQAGHIAAALCSCGRLDLFGKRFVAFHLSGGTTECLLVDGTDGSKDPVLQISLFAKSLDLKAGQAVDRVGGMLGLPFPSGKHLEALALQSHKTYSVKPSVKGVDCSLSGIENKCAGMVAKGEPPCDVARFCFDSLLAAVMHMTRCARENFGNLPILYAGGVMSSVLLRAALEKAFEGCFAEPALSGDNAAGVAILAWMASERSGAAQKGGAAI